MEIDTEKFKETINANSEIEIEFTELVNNIKINDDGNIESFGGGLEVTMSTDYEIITLAGGVSDEANLEIMNTDYECDINE
ncbi:MAG: hypothetical protein LBU40_00270 [Methanobrevibacter sp.]|jgi:hypothetical protein|nr:hypothetical protein [Methanobrevibacter sp.]